MRRNLAPGCISSDVNLCQRKLWDPLFSFFFLSPAKVGSLEMQPGAKLQAYLGVSILQPHACTQRFRQMLDGRVLGASQVEYKPFGKPPLQREHSQRYKVQVQDPADGLRGCSPSAQLGVGLSEGLEDAA